MNDNVILSQFSLEKLFSMMRQVSENIDLLTLMSDENYANIMKKMSSIDSKIDEIMGKLDKLSNDSYELKQENRNIEQKIQLMTTKLSKIEEVLRRDSGRDKDALSKLIRIQALLRPTKLSTANGIYLTAITPCRYVVIVISH